MDGITNYTMGMSLSKLREMVKDREARRAAVHGVTKSQSRLRATAKRSERTMWGPGSHWGWNDLNYFVRNITLYWEV